jgi:uncharacterized protein YggU (UPF0235/DUF167 family)
MTLINSVPPFAQIESDGFYFWIKVTPKAAKNRVGQLIEGAFAKQVLQVYVTAPPSDNLANKAVIEVLAEYLHCAKSKINIVSGLTTREKKIFVKL